LVTNNRKKEYDLGKRTLDFARLVRTYVNELPKNITNLEYSKQLVRSSGSVGANYIEAEDALGKKDFGMRIKISRKEAKESWYWLELTEPREEQLKEKERLLKEAIELTKIFGSIVEKTK
jgi:four helix bundle protein